MQLRSCCTNADGHHGQSDAISGGALRGLCDRGPWPKCSILARKVSACQKCVHFDCLRMMPLAVVLLSIAAFCYVSETGKVVYVLLCCVSVWQLCIAYGSWNGVSFWSIDCGVLWRGCNGLVRSGHTELLCEMQIWWQSSGSCPHSACHAQLYILASHSRHDVPRVSKHLVSVHAADAADRTCWMNHLATFKLDMSSSSTV